MMYIIFCTFCFGLFVAISIFCIWYSVRMNMNLNVVQTKCGACRPCHYYLHNKITIEHFIFTHDFTPRLELSGFRTIQTINSHLAVNCTQPHTHYPYHHLSLLNSSDMNYVFQSQNLTGLLKVFCFWRPRSVHPGALWLQ